jgi:hypothetical protein
LGKRDTLLKCEVHNNKANGFSSWRVRFLKKFQSHTKSWLLNGTAEVRPIDGSRVHNRAQSLGFSANLTHTINKKSQLGGQEIIFDCF